MNSAENDLREIRGYMERSSRFISLSGLSGVFAGIYALAGAAIGYFFFMDQPTYSADYQSIISVENLSPLVAIALVVLLCSLSTAYLLTTRNAKKHKQNIWDNTSKRMLINLAIPLLTGGLFVCILMVQGTLYLIAPSLLIFYGLALINGSKYTLHDIRNLGYCEIALGLLAMLFYGNGLLFWCIGFGVMHIVYGSIMYWKYER
jgi:hypothetical protein